MAEKYPESRHCQFFTLSVYRTRAVTRYILGFDVAAEAAIFGHNAVILDLGSTHFVLTFRLSKLQVSVLNLEHCEVVVYLI